MEVQTSPDQILSSPNPSITMSKFYVLHPPQDLLDQIHLTLRCDPYVGMSPIHVEVVDGDLILKGSVRSYFQKQMAQESLRHIEGFSQIINRLDVVKS